MRNIRKLAEVIANELFRTGTTIQADHLQLYRNGKYLVEWDKKSAIDAIEDVLRAEGVEGE